MKINFEEKFKELNSISDILKKVDSNNKVKIFYGLSKDGKKRLAFLSTIVPERIESTKMISVSYYNDNENINWLSFDLENNNFSNLFYIFCSDIVNSLNDINNEEKELDYLKKRFYNWKKMFQNVFVKELSEEKEQGLYGELYFLYKYMIPKYGVDVAVASWAGPHKFNKDFSVNETWYELKTSSVNATTIEIRSINQLDSDMVGYLSVVKVEKMSPEYKGKLSSVFDLIQAIMNEITSINIQDDFLNKLIESGVGPENNFGFRRYDTKNIILYEVSYDFPRLTKNTLSFNEIENVTYTIYISGIERFKAEEL